MNTQTLINPVMLYNFVVAPEEPISASSRDYGFDFDEEELANELLAPLPAALSTQSIPEVNADEFEKVFQTFFFVTGEPMTPTRVLIVDDVEQVRRDLRTALSISGEVEIIGEAANGRNAIRLVESLKPDAVLMDLEMPVMNGYDATRQIKSRIPSCKVIALTVHDYESARMRARDAGVNAFIVKGASVQNIVQTIFSRSRKPRVVCVL